MRWPTLAREYTITVRSLDTDVFIFLLKKYAKNIPQNILFDTGVWNKTRLIDINKGIAQTEGFLRVLHYKYLVRKRKIAPIKTLKLHQEFIGLCSVRCCNSNASQGPERAWNVYCPLYRGRGSHTSDINKLHYEKYLKQYSSSKKLLCSNNGHNLSFLPLCRDFLLMHIERANFRPLCGTSDTAQNQTSHLLILTD